MSRDQANGTPRQVNINPKKQSNNDIENAGSSSQTDFERRSENRLISPDNREQSERDQVYNDNHYFVLDWRSRIKHFTWPWFTVVMSTGGIANVIHSVPYRFHGLYAIGVAFQILALTIFVLNCTAIFIRFWRWPSTFVASFTHPTESLFVPAFMISIATILVNTVENGLAMGKTGPWLAKTSVVLFWIYVVVAVVFSTTIYLIMWSTQSFTLSRMTPVWIFPAYPLLLAGPMAGVLTNAGLGVPKARALEIIVGGVVVQGMGFLLSLTMHATYIYRLMSQKLPEESSRPAMFISVGPSAFTVNGLIIMGRNIPRVVSDDFMGNGLLAGQISQILAYWAGMWLFGIAIFFFLLAVGAHWSCIRKRYMHFSITWNAFIFPNTAFITALFAVGTALNQNRVINIIGCVLTVILVIAWIVVIIFLIRAVFLKQILWPQKQEDSDEHYLDEPVSRGSRQR